MLRRLALAGLPHAPTVDRRYRQRDRKCPCILLCPGAAEAHGQTRAPALETSRTGIARSAARSRKCAHRQWTPLLEVWLDVDAAEYPDAMRNCDSAHEPYPSLC